MRVAMSGAKEKFATQVTSQILAEVRALAHSEGRQLQALIDEALVDLLEKRKNTRPRLHVMSAYLASHEKFAELYRRLAK
jgi:hypothetical protein